MLNSNFLIGFSFISNFSLPQFAFPSLTWLFVAFGTNLHIIIFLENTIEYLYDIFLTPKEKTAFSFQNVSPLNNFHDGLGEY